jgi:hypothetical protein
LKVIKTLAYYRCGTPSLLTHHHHRFQIHRSLNFILQLVAPTHPPVEATPQDIDKSKGNTEVGLYSPDLDFPSGVPKASEATNHPLESQVPDNPPENMQQQQQHTDNGCPALILAATQGDLPAVEIFLEAGGNPLAHGLDALEAASRNGHEDVFMKLLTSSKDTLAVFMKRYSKAGQTLLTFATNLKCKPAILMLLERGAGTVNIDFEATYSWEALSAATVLDRDSDGMVAFLLEHGVGRDPETGRLHPEVEILNHAAR